MSRFEDDGGGGEEGSEMGAKKRGLGPGSLARFPLRPPVGGRGASFAHCVRRAYPFPLSLLLMDEKSRPL